MIHFPQKWYILKNIPFMKNPRYGLGGSISETTLIKEKRYSDLPLNIWIQKYKKTFFYPKRYNIYKNLEFAIEFFAGI